MEELSLELVGRLNCLSFLLWWLQNIQITSLEKPFETISSWVPMRFATVLCSWCMETTDRENTLFHFSCLFKILDTHRYQQYRLQNSGDLLQAIIAVRQWLQLWLF